MKSPISFPSLSRVFAVAIGLIAIGGIPRIGHAATQTWGNAGGFTDFNAGTSWLSGTAPIAGDIAAFNAAAAVQPNLTSSLSIGQLYFNTTTASGYALSSSGTAVKLTLTSVGSTQATASIGAANTSGTNTISAGLIFGAAAGTTQYINQSTGGTLALTGVVESTNAINLNFQGPGVYLINGANTYSGTTTVSWGSGGNLRLGNKSALGTSTLHTSNNNALISASTDLTGVNKITNNISLGSNVQIGSGQPIEFGGNVNLNGQTRNITTQSGSISTFSGVISNDGGQGLTLIASGAVTLSGTNTFTGAFQFRGNEPIIVSFLNNSGTAGNVGAGSIIRFGTAGSPTASNMRYVGSGETTNRTIDLGGTTGAVGLAQEGTGLLRFTSDVTVSGTGSKTFTLAGSTAGAGEISGRIPDGPAGSVITLAKAGTGLWTLSGSNSYSGGTVLAAGTLGLGHKNALGTGTLTFGNSATATALLASTALTGANAVANTISINSSGAATITGTNALQLSGTVTGSQIATARTLTVDNTALTTMSGPVFLASGTSHGSGLIFNGSGNLTISGNISDNTSTGTNSTLTYAGSGILRLEGSNTYRGLTTVSGQGGTLQLGSTGALGASSGVSVSATGATLDLNGQNYTTAINVTNLAGRLTNTSTTAAVYTGDVTTSSTSVIDGVGDITLNGNTTGNSLFVKTGTNTLTLGGTTNNTSLSLTLNQGTVVLNKTGNTAIRNGVVINGGLLQLAGTGGNQILNNVSSPGVIINGGTFDVNTRNETVTSLQIGGTGSGSITGSTGVLTVSNTIDARNGSSSAILSGTAGLTKTTSGTVALTAVNTYTGATIISEGTLLLSGAANNIANSSVINVASGAILDVSGVSGFTLASGQTLEGVGTVEGALTVGSGATLAIGNSPGTMTFAGGLTLAGGSVSNFEINSLTAGFYDVAQGGSGIQAVAFGGTLNLIFQAGFNTLGTIKIFDFESYSGTFTAVNPTGLDGGYFANFDAVTGEVTVVPEPSTWALLSLGFGALVLRARSRRRAA